MILSGEDLLHADSQTTALQLLSAVNYNSFGDKCYFLYNWGRQPQPLARLHWLRAYGANPTSRCPPLALGGGAEAEQMAGGAAAPLPDRQRPRAAAAGSGPPLPPAWSEAAAAAPPARPHPRRGPRRHPHPRPLPRTASVARGCGSCRWSAARGGRSAAAAGEARRGAGGSGRAAGDGGGRCGPAPAPPRSAARRLRLTAGLGAPRGWSPASCWEMASPLLAGRAAGFLVDLGALGESCCCAFMESLGLEKASEIIWSKHTPNSTITP